MKNYFKIIGGFAFAAFFVGTSLSNANASNIVPADDISVFQTADLDELMTEKEWEFVSSEYVYKAKVTVEEVAPSN